MRKLALLVLLCLATAANADIIFQPANPTSGDPVTVRFSGCVEGEPESVVVSGTSVTITYRRAADAADCIIGTLPYREIPIGRLAPQNYSVTVRVFRGTTLVLTETELLAVVPGSVPSLDPTGLGILAITLAFAALLVMRRT